MFQQNFRINQGTHFVFSNFIRKSFRLSDNVEKYCRAGQATDENMAQGIAGYIPKSRITLSE
jgi:hypothetical protein